MIAAATVFISLTDGADRLSRACSTLIVDRQQLGQAERRAHGRDARPGAARARHVVQKVVQQLERRRIGVARFALLVQPLHLAIGLAEQALDRGAAFEPAFAQRFEHRADDPPQLEHRLRGRDLLELLGGARQDFEVLLDALALDPAEQAELEAGAQLARPLRRPSARLRRRRGTGFACWSELRFSSSSVPSDSSARPRTARRSFSSGSSTSAMSRPPLSTRSR